MDYRALESIDLESLLQAHEITILESPASASCRGKAETYVFMRFPHLPHHYVLTNRCVSQILPVLDQLAKKKILQFIGTVPCPMGASNIFTLKLPTLSKNSLA